MFRKKDKIKPEDDKPHETATATIMRAMEDFARSEAKFIAIVYANESDELMVYTNAKRTQLVGLLECGKHCVLNMEVERKEDEETDGPHS